MDERTPLIADESTHQPNAKVCKIVNPNWQGSDRQQLNIAHISPEFAPLIWGGLGLAVSGLASQQWASGHLVAVILPYTDDVRVNGKPPKIEFSLKVSVADGTSFNCTVLSARYSEMGLPVFFLHNTLFNDGNLYSYSNANPESADAQSSRHNDNKFLFWSAAALQTIKRFIFSGGLDIVHVHDWTCSFCPYLLRQDNFFNLTAVILTIHNLLFQGLIPMAKASAIGIPSHLLNGACVFQEQFTMLRMAIAFADHITTVSPTYCKESLLGANIETGFGVSDILSGRFSVNEYSGILNGVDNSWNPAVDVVIHHRYDSESIIDGKKINKAVLQEELGLDMNEEAILIVACCRITEQKGLQFIVNNGDYIVANFQLLIVGDVSVGDLFGMGLKLQLEKLSSENPRRVRLLPYSQHFERKGCAAADIFWMVSTFEPCGIANQVASKYGAVVIASPTGGLMDAVTDIRINAAKGNGFFVSLTEGNFSAEGVRATLETVRDTFAKRDLWEQMVKNSAIRDASWAPSEAKYMVVYRQALWKVRSSANVEISVADEELGGNMKFIPDTKDSISTVWKCCCVQLNVHMFYNIRKVLDESKIMPGRADFMYVLLKTCGINIAVRAYFMLEAVSEGSANVEQGAASLVWYQMQDGFFTLFGQTVCQQPFH